MYRVQVVCLGTQGVVEKIEILSMNRPFTFHIIITHVAFTISCEVDEVLLNSFQEEEAITWVVSPKVIVRRKLEL